MFQQNYSKFYDLFNQNKPYRKEIEFINEWAGFPMSILDIGCGTADYWKHYPKWVNLTGIEKSRDMIRESRYKSLIIKGDVTKKSWKKEKKFDCVTALFDVINYIPKHDWWKNLPLRKGGHFIFDVWDKEKVDKDGFEETVKEIDGLSRRIVPKGYNRRQVNLEVQVWDYCDLSHTEVHKMYLHSHEDILRFCGKEFEVVQVKLTSRWQSWYKLRCK